MQWNTNCAVQTESKSEMDLKHKEKWDPIPDPIPDPSKNISNPPILQSEPKFWAGVFSILVINAAHSRFTAWKYLFPIKIDLCLRSGARERV